MQAREKSSLFGFGEEAVVNKSSSFTMCVTCFTGENAPSLFKLRLPLRSDPRAWGRKPGGRVLVRARELGLAAAIGRGCVEAGLEWSSLVSALEEGSYGGSVGAVARRARWVMKKAASDTEEEP